MRERDANMFHKAVKERRAVIITAIPIEYKVVRTFLEQVHEELHPKGNRYERGIFQTKGCVWDIGIVECGKLNQNAALQTERAIDYFQAGLALFVGVAGGL